VNNEANVFPLTGTREPSQWWSDLQVNVYGPYLQTYNYLRQYLDNSQEPTGTVIILSSNIPVFTIPGTSAYTISKVANFRQAEFLNVEYPKLRSFAFHPGMVPTQMKFETLHDLAIDPRKLFA
jgi:NADP-dependent 3-hydroxy acid dehydrogenase YdfG